MADGVIAALAHVQPAEAEEALLDSIDAEHDAGWLDAGWATEALAAAFPETAAAMVDHWLKCARSYERVRALAALERLPAQLALPRLRLAASDPALAVRDGARRQWLRRFDTACPVGAESALGAELLERAAERPLRRASGGHAGAGERGAAGDGARAPDRSAGPGGARSSAPARGRRQRAGTRAGHAARVARRDAKRRSRPRSSSASGPSAYAACARSRRASPSPRASAGCGGWATWSSAGSSRASTRTRCARSRRGR